MIVKPDKLIVWTAAALLLGGWAGLGFFWIGGGRPALVAGSILVGLAFGVASIPLIGTLVYLLIEKLR